MGLIFCISIDEAGLILFCFKVIDYVLNKTVQTQLVNSLSNLK